METDNEKEEEASTLRNVAVGSAATETVSRYGSANAEYVKAYNGIDREIGKVLRKGLKSISESKVNPDYHRQNIKQQAGFSAEVHKVASTNAENIISKKSERLSRTDDLPDQFGTNHSVYDHVEVDANGIAISGTGSQMKFLNDYEGLLGKIAQGRDGGKNDLSRYLDAKLALPTEQVEAARTFCAKRAESLSKQARILEKKGNVELAARKRVEADNFEKLRENIRDSGITTEDAIFFREHPKVATVKAIAATSHHAGVQGAKFGATIGVAISTVTNLIAVCQDNKEVGDALRDVVRDTRNAAALGYGTGFAGSALKGCMQQSSSVAARTLAKTSMPALAVTVCLEVGTSVIQYARGEIDGVEFMERLGEKGIGMLASGLGATLGQIGIPIPVVGALVGGMIGYTLSSMLYKDALQTFKDAKRAHEDYLQTKAFCEAARVQLEAYRIEFCSRFQEWLQEGQAELAECMSRMDGAIMNGGMEEFAASANALAACMGKSLDFANRNEFDMFMATEAELVL